MAENLTLSPTKQESDNTSKDVPRAGKKRVPINVEALAGITSALINEAINGGFSVRVGKTKDGGLLLALDALTTDDNGVVVPKVAPQVEPVQA